MISQHLQLDSSSPVYFDHYHECLFMLDLLGPQKFRVEILDIKYLSPIFRFCIYKQL